jgi:predicted lipid-binding transport protein (Tim44 family)
MLKGKHYATAWALALAMVVMLAAAADARTGGGGNYGSRGSRTFSNPPATNTAPRAAPIEKSFTQPGKAPTAPAAAPSRFGGWGSILAGGLIAGALASIFGFGALANVMGFLLQAALIAGIVWLVMSYFRRRQLQPATVQASAGMNRPPSGVDYRLGSTGGGNSALEIGSRDYDAFERLLGDIQLAYGRADESALSRMVTPEMLSYFAQDLEADRRKGLRNEVASPKLLQGDLSEAWREPGGEYATVAMRFSLIDATVDGSGRVVSGSRTVPKEVTEFWTFRRQSGGTPSQWELSAIQQSGERLPLAS